MKHAEPFILSLPVLSSLSSSEENEIRKLSRRTYFMFMSRCLPILPVCILLVFLLSRSFLPGIQTRLFLSVPLGIFPFNSCVRVLYGKRTSTLRAQNKVLMQSLCTSVSDGYSIERAFLCARVDIEKAFSRHCAFALALKDVEHQLNAHEPLDRCMTRFCHKLDYYETLPVLHALSLQKTVGNQIISILRSSCQMLSELHAVASEVEANNTGKNTEALLLSIMPFGITYMLSVTSADYLFQAQQSGIGKLLMTIAFVISVFSGTYLFSLIGEKPTKSVFTFEKHHSRMKSKVYTSLQMITNFNNNPQSIDINALGICKLFIVLICNLQIGLLLIDNLSTHVATLLVTLKCIKMHTCHHLTVFIRVCYYPNRIPNALKT